MSERTPEESAPAETGPDDGHDVGQEAGQEIAEPERSGVDEVDQVLDSVQGLDDVPIDDHVAVFESAHERLRGALDGSTDV